MLFIYRIYVAIILSGGLSYHGIRKKSLSISGCLAAFGVGVIAFASSVRFGVILIAFYYSSSKLTKLQEKKKSILEDDYMKGGQRNAIQVLANSILGSMVCLLYWIYVGEDCPVSAISYLYQFNFSIL